MKHVCAIYLVFALASAQVTTPNPPAQTVADASQGSTSSSPQTSPFSYQNTQNGAPLSAEAGANNANQGNLFAQGQFNPILAQNAQIGAGLNVGQFGLEQLGNVQPNILGGIQPGGFPAFGGFQGFNQPFGNGFQFNAAQGAAPQPVQDPITKEVRVPHPYPIYINKPVPVQVPVQVPVEVPKPYPIRIPHPVPVPVQVRVPVPVEKPYPVTITRTIPVPVEKPVYIRVPEIVPQSYQNAHPLGFSPEGYQQQVNPAVNLGQFNFQQQQLFPQEVQIAGRIQNQFPEGRQLNQPSSAQAPIPAYSNGAALANPGIAAQQRVGSLSLLSGEVQKETTLDRERNLGLLKSNEVRSDNENRSA